MKVVQLKGGMGNQLFQYAAAYDKVVYFDFSFLEHQPCESQVYTKRNFELNIFPNLKWKKFNTFHNLFFFSKINFFEFFRKFLNIKIVYVKQIENEFVQFSNSKYLYFDGYFQSENYFKNKRDKILKSLSFPDLDEENCKIKLKILNYKNPVSIHIRRGDYLKKETLLYHGVINQDYYDFCISSLSKEFSDLHFFVFTDDYEYACELFSNKYSFSIIGGNSLTPWKDMALMSFCKHHIIANSSFSWWGAWLSDQRGKKFAPKNWFNSKIVNYNINEIVPKEWIIV